MSDEPVERTGDARRMPGAHECSRNMATSDRASAGDEEHVFQRYREPHSSERVDHASRSTDTGLAQGVKHVEKSGATIVDSVSKDVDVFPIGRHRREFHRRNDCDTASACSGHRALDTFDAVVIRDREVCEAHRACKTDKRFRCEATVGCGRMDVQVGLQVRHPRCTKGDACHAAQQEDGSLSAPRR